MSVTRVMLKLVCLQGPFKGLSRVLSEGRYVLGRDPRCDIQLGDPSVSGTHAELSVGEREVAVEDLGSRNGVFIREPVKQNKVEYARLNDRDIFYLGQSVAFGVRLLALRPAGFWARAVAILLDGLALTPVLWIGYAQILGDAGVHGFIPRQTNDAGVQVACGLWGLFVCFAYEVLMNGRWGQTLGKMAIGIRIVRVDGSPISYSTAFYRYFLQILLCWLTLGISYIAVALQLEKRSWYDMAAGTRVVYSRELNGG